MEAPIKLLDGGYVRFVEAWGTGDAGANIPESKGSDVTYDDYECGIVEAARQSTQGSFRGWEEDEKLLKSLYLSDPQHSTPFEFSGATIEIQGPLIVFREWHRHRTQSYNEMSARYAPMPDNNYLPEWSNLKERGEAAEKTRNKQEKGIAPWDPYKAMTWLHTSLPFLYRHSQQCYEEGLNAGVPKELARLAITVGRYSRMRATANLRNWLAFITLRFDPNAQWEIRQYAAAVATILEKQFPRTWALYVEKKSPQHRIKKFTDDEILAEVRRRGIGG